MIMELIKKDGLGPEHYLFCSNRDKKYHMRSLQQIVKKATKKAKIDKNIGCHTLRHSFATHLIEDGSSVSEVQALLRHKNPKTTFFYVYTASPKLIKIK